MLPLTHGQHSNLALNSKMLLALLYPLLDCEQLCALKLTNDEASTCVSMLREAATAIAHHLNGTDLMTYLRVMVCFTQEHYRLDPKLSHKNCSEYEKKLSLVSDELKTNLELFVKSGVLSVLSEILKLKDQIEVRIMAMRLLWCLAHSPTVTVKTQILENDDIVQALQSSDETLTPKLYMASRCVLALVDHLTKGMF